MEGKRLDSQWRFHYAAVCDHGVTLAPKGTSSYPDSPGTHLSLNFTFTGNFLNYIVFLCLLNYTWYSNFPSWRVTWTWVTLLGDGSGLRHTGGDSGLWYWPCPAVGMRLALFKSLWWQVFLHLSRINKKKEMEAGFSQVVSPGLSLHFCCQLLAP